MGSGSFDYSSSTARSQARAATGQTAFKYHQQVQSGQVAREVHPSLDLRQKPQREARDQDGRAKFPIFFAQDVTGSVGAIADHIIKDLGRLMKVTIEEDIIPDPAICFAALGDAHCDEAPYQVGEFESDDQLAEAHLANIWKEGSGGGNGGESYGDILWLLGNRIHTDAYEKRGERGIAILCGDEPPHPMIRKADLAKFMGINVEADIPLSVAVQQAKEKWHVLCVRPGQTSWFDNPGVQKTWEELLGPECVLKVEDWHNVVPTVAAAIAAVGGHTAAAINQAMQRAGFDPQAVNTATQAIVPLSNSLTPTLQGSELVSGGAGTGARL